MTTESSKKPENFLENKVKLEENLKRIEELSARLMQVMSRRSEPRSSLQGPGSELYVRAASAFVAQMMENPSKVVEHQIGYWGKSLRHYLEANQKLSEGKLEAPQDRVQKDKRFSNPLWDNHPYFNFLKQQYLLNAEAVENAVGDLDGLDVTEQKRIEFFSRQIVDMFSPSNFLGTNPDALARAAETDGQSLVDGLENLVSDLEANDGNLQVTLADKNAFHVGENLATTPGKVVFRNRMFELIQYTPTTKEVHDIPLVIFPPWINKFYVLDLKEKNSLIKWIVDQGFTLFVVSWVNPNASYFDVSLDNYINDGYLTAIDVAKSICGTKSVNAVGYCIGGTTLSLALALQSKRGTDDIGAATLFTTMTDFSDQGEMSVFLNDDFVDGIEEEVIEKGYLDSYFMSRTFSFLRSNDLIYGPAIKSYMMGQAPPAFDLLYWNGDSTNLPGKMAIQYLRDLCQNNLFASSKISICGEELSLKDVQTPVFAIGCETDHIAAWDASLKGVSQMSATDKTYVLSQSGHIAGIVNPPSKNKYGHYTNTDFSVTPDAWKDGAEFHEGSWWPRWKEWLADKSGPLVPARTEGSDAYPVLGNAPGQYVLEGAAP